MRMMEIITKHLDVKTNSPKWYHKKYMENSEENKHADIGAERDKAQMVLLSVLYDLTRTAQPTSSK